MADEVAEMFSIKSMTRAIYKVPCTCLSSFTMACPFLDDVLDEEALILRRAFRREGVFRDRSDPLAFPYDYLHERYRFSGDGIPDTCADCWVPKFSTAQHRATP